jgi:hypothetical protein
MQKDGQTDTAFLLYLYLCKADIILSRNSIFNFRHRGRHHLKLRTHTKKDFELVILTLISLDLTDVNQRDDVNILSERWYGAWKPRRRQLKSRSIDYNPEQTPWGGDVWGYFFFMATVNGALERPEWGQTRRDTAAPTPWARGCMQHTRTCSTKHWRHWILTCRYRHNADYNAQGNMCGREAVSYRCRKRLRGKSYADMFAWNLTLPYYTSI